MEITGRNLADCATDILDECESSGKGSAPSPILVMAGSGGTGGGGLCGARHLANRGFTVVEEDASEISCFEERSCRRVEKNTVSGRVAWKNRESLAPPKSCYIRLAFHIKDADFYFFWIE